MIKRRNRNLSQIIYDFTDVKEQRNVENKKKLL
jgi:hypothetical protein